MSEQLRWTLRTTLMFFAGVVPAILLLLFILVVLPLAGIVLELVQWLAVLASLALLGIAGLWTATFRDEGELILPNAVTIALVLCGLIGAVPYLIVMTPQAVADGGSTLFVAACLLGTVICGSYFLVEQFLLARRRRSVESSSQP